MADSTSTPTRRPTAQMVVENDIYTALLGVATFFLLTATVVVTVQFHRLYDLSNLFEKVAP